MTTAAPGGVGRDGRFAVWAPEVETVAVVVDHTAHPMARDEAPGGAEQGWWFAHVEGTGHGTAYAYSLDGADPLPDPRSRWQPDGGHAASRVWDPASSPLRDQVWTGRALPGAVIYEMHVGTFTPGRTFDDAVERLGQPRARGDPPPQR